MRSFKSYYAALKNAQDTIQGKIYDVIKESAHEYKLTLRGNAPVDTGFLAESFFEQINVDGNKYSLDIGNRADYAAFVDKGHMLKDGQTWKGYGFYQKSLEDYKGVFHDKVLKMVKELL